MKYIRWWSNLVAFTIYTLSSIRKEDKSIGNLQDVKKQEILPKPKKSKISKKMSTPEEQERYEEFVEYLAYLLRKYGNRILKK